MKRYLFIYYKINDLRSKTIVNVCMYIYVGAYVFILDTTTPDENKNTGKIQNRSG